MFIKDFNRKFLALTLIAVILAFSTIDLCRETHTAGLSPESDCSKQNTVAGSATTTNQCPSSPADEHSRDDHDNSGCYCGCHLPLTSSAISASYLPCISILTALEPFKAIPEIYIDLFIPPQNQA